MAIVLNNSKGYNYDYANLTDINKQGFEIPKMKTGTDPISGKSFVFYYDTELKDWIQGAEIVIPESKGMNKAQLYGSALTYARRYTTLMALQLCCGDDNIIEDLTPDGERKNVVQPKQYDPELDDGEPATPKQLEVLKKLAPNIQANIINHFGLDSMDEISKAQAIETISKMRKK